MFISANIRDIFHQKKRDIFRYLQLFLLFLLLEGIAFSESFSFDFSKERTADSQVSPPLPPQFTEEIPLTASLLSVKNRQNSSNSSFNNNEAQEVEEVSVPFSTQEEPSKTALEELQKSLDEMREEIDYLKIEQQKKTASSSNRKFTTQVGGFLEIDAVTIDQDSRNRALYGDINNDFDIRDLRLWVKGKGYGNLGYEAALGFSGSLSFKNVMLTASDLPILGDAKLGYFKVESGLNYLQNVYNNTFVDWETNNRTFQVGRRLGVGSVHYSEDKNWRLFTGIFTGQNLQIGDKKNSNENNDNPGIILNTRFSGVPIYTVSEDGCLDQVLHLGVGYRWVDPGRDTDTGKIRKTTLKSFPSNWTADMSPLLYGSIRTNSYTVTNIETAFQKKRFGVIGEGFIGTYNGYDNAYGVSAAGRFLLTPGCYQKYNKENGVFGEINIPNEMQFIRLADRTAFQGPGAWEIAGEWAWTDLGLLSDSVDDDTVYGKVNQYTAALNWYWNPQVRWGINWTFAKPISAKKGDEQQSTELNTLAFQSRITF